MAINSLDIFCDKTTPKTQYSSTDAKSGYLPSSRLIKINFATEGSIVNTAVGKHGKVKKNGDFKSPYLAGDSVHMLSRVTEKRFLHKKGTNITSSFPLAVNLYKTNSDDFKPRNNIKKVKKSVLTLPSNDLALLPQTCTVSDMNDSEYFNREDVTHKKPKKRTPTVQNRRSRGRGKDFEFYDRDAHYCSQMNIDLDCSSTDLIKNFNGDGKRKCKTKSIAGSKAHENANPHDVWAVLRNINRFQFRPSPPLSEESFNVPKKKKGPKRRANRKDMRVVGTCRTEEFAYISSYEVDSKSPRTFSRSSSFDRITVIDKEDEFSKLCKEFEKRVVNTKNNAVKDNNNKNGKQTVNKAKHRNVQKTDTKVCAVKPNKLKELTYANHKNATCEDASEMNKIVNHEKKDDIISSTNIHNTSPVRCDEFIYSGNSGSSKAAFLENKMNNNITDKNNVGKVYSDESDQHFNGITKVVLSKGQTMVQPSKPDLPKRKPRQTTTMPSSPVIVPKLTQTELRRRINKLKFPIVILGKDQLSSSFEVIKQEPPQFDGMKEQIWPFMLGWHGIECKGLESILKEQTNKKSVDSNLQRKKGTTDETEKNKCPKNKNSITHGKQSKIKDKKSVNDSKTCNKTKTDLKRIPVPPADIIRIQSQESEKPRPIRQFKDRMLKLLYKNSSMHNVSESNDNQDVSKTNVKVENINKNKTDNKLDVIIDDLVRAKAKSPTYRPVVSPIKQSIPASPERRPWAKAKWASDFIDNVIRKIKNGVYYTNDNKVLNQKEAKEVDVQTIPYSDDNRDSAMKSISKITIKKKSEPLTVIPGFDNTLPTLEIKTMNMNEISVKHCVTNIIVHFDVTVPIEPVLGAKKSSSLIPLDITESHTKIFKCKTSLVNAMLPAELCSILPKMMSNLVESSEQLGFPPLLIDKTVSHLSTISEITRCESRVPSKVSLPYYVQMSSEVRILLNGRYENSDMIFPKLKILGKMSLRIKYDRHLIEELIPQLTRSNLFDWMIEPTTPLAHKCKNNKLTSSVTPDQQINTCTALQLYSAADRRVVPAFKSVNFMRFFENICTFINISEPHSQMFRLFPKNHVITIGMTLGTLQDTVTLTMNNLKISAPLNNCWDRMSSINKITFFSSKTDVAPSNCIKNINSSSTDDKKLLQNPVSVSNNKMKKKGFVKLYKKCKSTSNISSERTSTPLNKITTLEDFFQALGLGKLLCNVFDSRSGHKIMSSVREMKNWTTEINTKQALLVLLLTNKKDTSNLVRFRPVLLQGIAVNRITRANELDMEIEVIERENLNRLSQYEGISYVPASIENQDNLLEELYWIAKTTASDYQRTFDESSEKLLKSLLEKRKKLNPSYLRVMARYVGLGLLKSRGK